MLARETEFSPGALRAVTEGPDGVAAGVAAPTTVFEMSTVGPAAVARLASVLPDGVDLRDAPVLGSLSEAEAGTLRIFVGGPSELVDRAAPLRSALGSPVHVGSLGAGAAAMKDADLVVEAAAAAGVDLRLASAAQSWFAAAEDDGQGDQDYSAVLARIAAV